MTDYTDLIEKLEAATGPNRELDIEWALANWTPYADYTHVRKAILAEDCDIEEVGISGVHAVRVPHYTASLDAVLAEMPEGWVGYVEIGKRNEFEAYITDNKGRFLIQGDKEIYGRGATPAIALMIAILKAKETE